MVSLSNQTEGTLAEPGADYVAVSDSVILKEGETSAAINVTLLEVNSISFHSIFTGMTIEKEYCGTWIVHAVLFEAIKFMAI